MQNRHVNRVLSYFGLIPILCIHTAICMTAKDLSLIPLICLEQIQVQTTIRYRREYDIVTTFPRAYLIVT
jgi:hypothetical protein